MEKKGPISLKVEWVPVWVMTSKSLSETNLVEQKYNGKEPEKGIEGGNRCVPQEKGVSTTMKVERVRSSMFKQFAAVTWMARIGVDGLRLVFFSSTQKFVGLNDLIRRPRLPSLWLRLKSMSGL